MFWISLQFLSENFLILRRTVQDATKMSIGLHEKYPLFLSDFNGTSLSSMDFRKIQNYHISWKSVQWKPSCSTLTDRQTDRHDEANSRFFAILRRRLKRNAVLVFVKRWFAAIFSAGQGNNNNFDFKLKEVLLNIWQSLLVRCLLQKQSS